MQEYKEWIRNSSGRKKYVIFLVVAQLCSS